MQTRSRTKLDQNRDVKLHNGTNGSTTNGSLSNDSMTNGLVANGKSNPNAPPTSLTGIVYNFLVRTLFPLLLLIITPNFVLWMWYTCKFYDGSYQRFGEDFIASQNPVKFLLNGWMQVNICSKFSLIVISGYIAFQLLLMKIVPGQCVKGPLTPNGNTPVYTDNGFSIYIITMITFAGLTCYLKMFTPYSPSLVYDNFGDLLATMNVLSMVFCVVLYFKGVYWPSSTDSGTSGNVIFDYYWGTELYPRICGWDVKVLTNCRFGCTVWALLPCCYYMKSYELHGMDASINSLVSLTILLVYLTKFFYWEAGYMCTIDIILDRAGYYICWGCLCYIPGLYTVFSYYLVSHPYALGYPLACAILLAGLLSVSVNYVADWQKQLARSTNGNCIIWGKKPELIRAKYMSGGKEKTSLLLVSGFWGMARHFHYLPELCIAFFCTVPAGFTNILPYSYLMFLTMLLVHRTYRDDIKCGEKYGQYWKDYQQRVPYRIIPYVF